MTIVVLSQLHAALGADARLPLRAAPLAREHRLYQAHWLIRRHGFDAAELTRADAPTSSRQCVVNAMTRRGQEERRGRDAIHAFPVQYDAMLRGAVSRFAHVTVGDGAAPLFGTMKDAGGGRYDGATLLEFDRSGGVTPLRRYCTWGWAARATR